MTNEMTVIKAGDPRAVVLFCAGRGGSAARHMPFLEALAAKGLTVIAPHFDMMPMTPTAADLETRIAIAERALSHAPIGLPVVGIGHSIGGVILLIMAGATATTLAGEVVSPGAHDFARLVTLASPIGFFRRPGALDAVRVPVSVRSGALDTLTAPDQAQFLANTLAGATLTIDADAAHFTYMNDLPPQTTDPHPDRVGFLKALAAELAATF